MRKARWGGDYFKHFGQRGAIIPGRQLIEGRLLFEEIQYGPADSRLPCGQHI